MTYYVGQDAHKNYSEFAVMDERSQVVHRAKVMHSKGAIKTYLQRLRNQGGFGDGRQLLLDC